jgi:hypothetical protein
VYSCCILPTPKWQWQIAEASADLINDSTSYSFI